ncbi:zinc-binding dehydrogenase [Streptomyces sp. NPDC048473]|uniref:zinc-binding dehydrogenase n=1 Tax=unclassified Streptomyces TaxID=2593676 RepID=UPI003721F823
MAIETMRAFVLRRVGEVGVIEKPVPEPGPGDAVVRTTQATVRRILELTDGQGVDAAIEALGTPRTWEATFRVTKPGGRISNVGYHGDIPEPLRIPLEPFGYGMSGKQVYGGLNCGGRERMRRIFRLLEHGKVDPTLMTTHEFGFDEIERAFRMMESREDGIIKPLIRCDPDRLDRRASSPTPELAG